MLAAQRGAGEDHLVVPHLTKNAEVTGLEGFHVAGVRLGDAARGVNLVVHGDHHALAGGLGGGGNADGIEQIARAVEVGRRGVALGADHDHRLVGLDGQVQPVGPLFRGVGSERSPRRRSWAWPVSGWRQILPFAFSSLWSQLLRRLEIVEGSFNGLDADCKA